MAYAIEFRTVKQNWTRMQPEKRYTGTKLEMQTVLDGPLSKLPFTIEGTKYRMVEITPKPKPANWRCPNPSDCGDPTCQGDCGY